VDDISADGDCQAASKAKINAEDLAFIVAAPTSAPVWKEEPDHLPVLSRSGTCARRLNIYLPPALVQEVMTTRSSLAIEEAAIRAIEANTSILRMHRG
jgi:hypothetical protein